MIRKREILTLASLSLVAGGGIAAYLMRGLSSAKCADKTLCSEREAQRSLPRSEDPIWRVLKSCRVGFDSKSGDYNLIPTEKVLALVGKTVRVKGFVVPLDGSDQTKDFLIGINTPVCFYHPPGEPNEIIEVKTKGPIPWSDRLVTVEGRFSLESGNQVGVFFRLNEAYLA